MSRTLDATKTAARLARLTRLRPALALVLGSGFQGVLERVESAQTIAYEKLPGFPAVGVAGHQGKLVLGQLGGVPVAILSGRFHYYEGHGLDTVTFPVRVLAEFGVRDLLLTNAAGGIHRRFRPGDFMALADHINFMGANPLRGAAVPGRERFVDLSETYSRDLRKLLRRAAKPARARMHEGVYLAVSGPSYETPAEIRAFARLGADAVGMSTVPEAIVARQCGLRVAAVSCITNLAAGRSGGPLSHHEVLALSQQVKAKTAALLENFAKLYAEEKSN
ncbi:MAG: purine-nucleoside phosphorylase [Verrucomicrobia bacterium]|nr:purine-nucleoside phosphorylase [Verrucomicrobiota bacterium]